MTDTVATLSEIADKLLNVVDSLIDCSNNSSVTMMIRACIVSPGSLYGGYFETERKYKKGMKNILHCICNSKGPHRARIALFKATIFSDDGTTSSFSPIENFWVRDEHGGYPFRYLSIDELYSTLQEVPNSLLLSFTPILIPWVTKDYISDAVLVKCLKCLFAPPTPATPATPPTPQAPQGQSFIKYQDPFVFEWKSILDVIYGRDFINDLVQLAKDHGVYIGTVHDLVLNTRDHHGYSILHVHFNSMKIGEPTTTLLDILRHATLEEFQKIVVDGKSPLDCIPSSIFCSDTAFDCCMSKLEVHDMVTLIAYIFKQRPDIPMYLKIKRAIKYIPCKHLWSAKNHHPIVDEMFNVDISKWRDTPFTSVENMYVTFPINLDDPTYFDSPNNIYSKDLFVMSELNFKDKDFVDAYQLENVRFFEWWISTGLRHMSIDCAVQILTIVEARDSTKKATIRQLIGKFILSQLKPPAAAAAATGGAL